MFHGHNHRTDDFGSSNPLLILAAALAIFAAAGVVVYLCSRVNQEERDNALTCFGLQSANNNPDNTPDNSSV